MAFSIKTWVDRISEYPNRRKLTHENGTTELVTVSRAEGQVSKEGNAFSAKEMNDLEKRISDEFKVLNEGLENKLPKGTIECNIIPNTALGGSYKYAPLTMTAYYPIDKGERAGIGFHNAGQCAGYLYLANDGGLYFMDNLGVDHKINMS